MHADQIPMSTLVGSTINRAGGMSLLTDAGVAAADTVAGLQSFVSGVNVHADMQPWKARINASFKADDGISDSTVLGLTTVVGLAALTQIGNKPNLDLYGD